MRIRSRTLLATTSGLLFLVLAGPAEAKKACVWYEVQTPVLTDDDEVCTPNVLPEDMNDHHTPQNCPQVPPLQTEGCVGADFYLYSA